MVEFEQPEKEEDRCRSVAQAEVRKHPGKGPSFMSQNTPKNFAFVIDIKFECVCSFREQIQSLCVCCRKSGTLVPMP